MEVWERAQNLGPPGTVDTSLCPKTSAFAAVERFRSSGRPPWPTSSDCLLRTGVYRAIDGTSASRVAIDSLLRRFLLASAGRSSTPSDERGGESAPITRFIGRRHTKETCTGFFRRSRGTVRIRVQLSSYGTSAARFAKSSRREREFTSIPSTISSNI